jgi:hypothetical protein
MNRNNIPVSTSNLALSGQKMKKKPAPKKMTMAQYEKSSTDKKMDKKELAAINAKRKKK